MKVNMVKNAGGLLSPADEQAETQMIKLKNCDYYSVDIKLNHNYRLHQKIFGFFGFCTNYNYRDSEASKDEYKLNRTRKKLTVSAGYYRQVFEPNGVDFEIVPLSLKYESMPDDKRQEFYKRMTQAALDNIFNDGTDENIINELLCWFK